MSSYDAVGFANDSLNNYVVDNLSQPDHFNIQICTPTAGSVKAAYATSLLGLVTHYLQYPIHGYERLNRLIGYSLLIGSTICASRERMVEECLADKTITHLLFIDDDMGFDRDCLNIALAENEPIILANYRMKSPPWRFTCVRKEADGIHEVRTTLHNDDVEDITYGGFGFCLIQRQVLKQVRPPRFLPQYKPGSYNYYTTEDLPFFESCAAVGFKPKVHHGLSKKIWHIGDFAYHHSTQFTSSPIYGSLVDQQEKQTA